MAERALIQPSDSVEATALAIAFQIVNHERATGVPAEPEVRARQVRAVVLTLLGLAEPPKP